MVIDFQVTSADGSNVATSFTVKNTMGATSLGSPSANINNGNVQADGKAGILIAADSGAGYGASAIQAWAIYYWNGSDWTLEAWHDYTNDPDTATGSLDALDGLTSLSGGNYYVSGGRLKRSTSDTAGANAVRYYNGTSRNRHRVVIIADQLTQITATSSPNHGTFAVAHLATGTGWGCYGGVFKNQAWTSSGNSIGYFNSTAYAATNSSLSSDPTSGGLFAVSPISFATESGSNLAITAPVVIGGTGTTTYDWRTVPSSLLTSTTLSDSTSRQSGTKSGAVPNLSIARSGLPASQLWWFCRVSDSASNAVNVGRDKVSGDVVIALGGSGIYTQSYSPAPSPLGNSALTALFNATGYASNARVIKIGMVGDSLSQNLGTDLQTLLDTVASGRFAVVNGGHSGSATADWLRTASATGTGQCVITGQTSKNNYTGTRDKVIATSGDDTLWMVCLGTNDPDAATITTNLGTILTDLRDATNGVSGSKVVALNGMMFNFALRYNDPYQTFLSAADTAVHALANGTTILDGDYKCRRYFPVHTDQTDLSLHPAAGTGRDAQVRFWAEALLTNLATLSPGRPKLFGAPIEVSSLGIGF